MKTVIKAQLLVDELHLLAHHLNSSLAEFDNNRNAKLILRLEYLREIFSHVGIDCEVRIVRISAASDGLLYFGVSYLYYAGRVLDTGWDSSKAKFDFVNDYINSHVGGVQND